MNVYRELPSWFNKYKIGFDVEEAKLLHRSEIEWIRCYKDYEIYNNGTIEELHDNIKSLLFKTT